MVRSIVKGLCTSAAVAAMLAFTVADANAGWGSSGGSWGSSGGSSGGFSHGSSGGSWGGGSFGSSGGVVRVRHFGSHGSSGGSSGLLSRLHHRIHSHFRHWGSSGGSSGGSWGGSSGGYAYHGGSHGSSGGSSGGGVIYGGPVYQSSPSYSAPAPEAAPASPAPAPVETTPAPVESTTSVDGHITVTVPGEAKVYVNGHRTRSTGEFRQYVSRNLRGGAGYTYQIRAEIEIDGKVVQDSREVVLRAGQTKHVSFTLEAPQQIAVEEPAQLAEPKNVEPKDTTLTLNVPEDARVYLGGNSTAAVGKLRTYTTAGLKDGQQWDDYKIVVAVERGGQLVTQERSITLKAGDQPVLDFDFDTTKVADAR